MTSMGIQNLTWILSTKLSFIPQHYWLKVLSGIEKKVCLNLRA